MEKTVSQRRIYLFLVVLFLEMMTSNLAHPLTPTIITNLGLHSYMFGLAFAAMSLTNFLTSPFWGKVSRLYSSRAVLAVSAFGYGIGQLMFCFAKTEFMIVFARCFAGMFIGGYMVCYLTYIVNVSAPEYRAKNLAITATISTVSSAPGYLIGGFLGEISIPLTFITQVFFLCLSGVLYYFVCVDDKPAEISAENKKIRWSEINPLAAFWQSREFLTGTVAFLFIAVFIANCGTNAFDQCFNYYIRDQFGFTSSYNGMIKAVVGVIALTANMTVCMWLIHHTDVRKSVIFILGACSAALLGVVLIRSMIPFFITVLVFYACNAMYIPLLQDCVARIQSGQNSNMVMAFYNTMRSLGMIIGALFAGFIYDLNPRSPFIMACVMFAAAALLEITYVRRSAAR